MTEDAKGNKTDGIAMFQRMIEMKLDKEKKRGNEMGKVFEDYFSELQTDMVEICMEYVEDRAEKIYIYCSFEGVVQSCNFFYKVNGKVVKKSRLNDVIVDGQEEYDVAANSLNADYSYDIIYSNDKDKMAEDVLEEWYESEKSKEE